VNSRESSSNKKKQFREDFDHFSNTWLAFVNDLIYSNRFFPKPNILSEIEHYASSNTMSIAPGTEFFRAREFESPYANLNMNERDILLGKDQQWPNEEYFLHEIVLPVLDAGIQDNLTIAEFLAEKAESGIWGYGESQSGKPPSATTEAGRTNPKYIPYLYLASDVDTALAEIRTDIGKKISVAKYEIVASPKIVHMCGSIHSADIEKIFEMFLFSQIHSMFSAPSKSSDKDLLSFVKG